MDPSLVWFNCMTTVVPHVLLLLSYAYDVSIPLSQTEPLVSTDQHTHPSFGTPLTFHIEQWVAIPTARRPLLERVVLSRQNVLVYVRRTSEKKNAVRDRAQEIFSEYSSVDIDIEIAHSPPGPRRQHVSL